MDRGFGRVHLVEALIDVAHGKRARGLMRKAVAVCHVSSCTTTWRLGERRGRSWESAAEEDACYSFLHTSTRRARQHGHASRISISRHHVHCSARISPPNHDAHVHTQHTRPSTEVRAGPAQVSVEGRTTETQAPLAKVLSAPLTR